MSSSDYTDTPHVKGSQSKPPRKAKHRHEYLRPYYMNRMRRFDGTISTELYKFYPVPATCLDCGHVKRRAKPGTYTEVEVSVPEGHKLRDSGN